MKISDVASELNIDALGVLRLIARRRLVAVDLGADRIAEQRWRVTADALADYARAGVPDLRPPGLDRGLLTREDQATLDAFRAGVRDITATQIDREKITAEVGAALDGKGELRLSREGYFSPRRLAVTPAMVALCRTPAAPPYGTLLDLTAALAMRETLGRVTSAPDAGGKLPWLGRSMYESPELYKELAVRALKDMLDGRVAWHRLEVRGHSIWFHLAWGELLEAVDPAAWGIVPGLQGDAGEPPVRVGYVRAMAAPHESALLNLAF